MKALVYISPVKLEKVAVTKLAGCELHRESFDKHHMLCGAYCSVLLAITANSTSDKLNT